MAGLSPAPQPGKAGLLQLMVRGRAARSGWIAGLTDEAKRAASAEGRWGAKATLAHMARWNLALLTALQLKARGEPVPYQWANLDSENARLLRESATRTWAEIAAEAETAFAALLGWAERLSEEQLAAADDFAWREGWPLWQTFLGNTYFHYLDHLAGYFAATGEAGRAAELRAELSEVYRALELHWR